MQFKLYGLCMPVKGFLRRAVYDLQNGSYFFVPLETEELFRTAESQFLESPIFENLKNENLICQAENPSFFEPFDSLTVAEFDYPSEITNAIVELDRHTLYKPIFDMLSANHYYNIQLFFRPIHGDCEVATVQ